MSSRTSTGYGPSTRLIFDGDEAKYELWEVKFKGYLLVQKLHGVVRDANPDAEKNAQVFAELVQVLDDKSINLIIRDADDDVKSVNKVEKDFHEHDDDAHNFVFKTNEQSLDPIKGNTLLVDSGATTHIVTDESKYIRFNDKFEPENHVIELADGSRTNGAVQGKGDAMVEMYDSNGKLRKGILQNALYVPSFAHDIFSVPPATEMGTSVTFSQDNAELMAQYFQLKRRSYIS
ncbi:hypothetical protein Pcinc_000748 [Petrolisthes cinctipes]|uniref:Retrovirus-related Pol polyprotein from transposon TNT 1-94-like beta-barrel domain-containing protein n=1 Tax=Petrolisthes cinctipes TaxID=88211 RepID=A0AAE1L3R1_PETCI|nr:hypothetical protein Pcinc_000748 [Petrolisthes cinctipes]